MAPPTFSYLALRVAVVFVVTRHLVFTAFLHKNTEIAYIDQRLKCTAPKRWSIYTTGNLTPFSCVHHFTRSHDKAGFTGTHLQLSIPSKFLVLNNLKWECMKSWCCSNIDSKSLFDDFDSMLLSSLYEIMIFYVFKAVRNNKTTHFLSTIYPWLKIRNERISFGHFQIFWMAHNLFWFNKL